VSANNTPVMGCVMHHAVLLGQFRHAVAPMPPSHRAKQPDESPIGYVGTLRRATAWTRKICTMPVAAGFVFP